MHKHTHKHMLDGGKHKNTEGGTEGMSETKNKDKERRRERKHRTYNG